MRCPSARGRERGLVLHQISHGRRADAFR
uniref:Uncharacterized protein n=1 Tax=Arundo donax TaxID=35708 RepID=A0A0A8YBE1_ARUDO